MKKKFMKSVLYGVVITMLMTSVNSMFIKPVQAAGDEYDALRDKWEVTLTGGSGYDPLDSDIANQISTVTATAQSYWDSMDKSPTRTYLWSDLAKTTVSSQITTAYVRLKAMAVANRTYGSTLNGNATLTADIISALDWMNTNRYNTTITTYDNWWDWQIGAPLALNDTTVLMYSSLTTTQITNYMNAVERFTPIVNKSGANRVWQTAVIGVRGIIVKDTAKVAAARDGLSALFLYVTGGDGFYVDGAFIQHANVAYTGGYGISLLNDLANLMYLLDGSTWTVTDVNKANVFEWIYKSYQPLLYKGAMMDLSRGREISRDYMQDHVAGHKVMQGIIRVSQFAPTADATAYKRMIKAWIEADTYRSFYIDATMNMIVLGKAIMNDTLISPAGVLTKYQQFSGMDRALLLRSGFGFGVSMFSSRVLSYEAINSENLKGWFTGAGMTSLYNNDLSQYSDDFWPTVDSMRLPGTTIVSQTTSLPHKSTKAWVGGVDILNAYGVSGMDLEFNSNTLTAKKSWFMFEDEIVALGAGVSSINNELVETVVENRKINSSGNNALIVNGTAQPTDLGLSQTLPGVSWAHLAGNVSGSDIGYYFPQSVNLQTIREARTGNWKQLNNRPVTPSTPITRNYLTMWLDHGVNPTNGSYQYVILPNKTSAQVSSYASNPDITVLENSVNAQGVKENTLNIVAVNFWNDALKTIDLITSDKKASVMTKETANDLEVSVSDPTKANTGVINIEINRAASSTMWANPEITITQLSPTIKFSVNVNAARGKTLKVKFGFTPAPATVIVDNADATGVTKVGTWTTASTQTDRYGANYLHDSNTGKGTKSVTFTPSLPSAGTYQVYMMWPAHENRATNIPVDINHSGGTSTVTINQQANGGIWNLLGTYTFDGGTSGFVKIRNDLTNGYVIADAVKFVSVP